MKKWTVSDLNRESASILAKECDIPIFTAMLLSLRGINDQDSARRFLSDEINIQSPFTLPDMDKACARINRAIDNFEEICVYGDYDADGVTATTLLYSYLSDIGANVIYMIPDRQNDGYGLNIKAIDSMLEHNIKLIITVDNGITADEEIAYANENGIDTVVTDHHTPPDTLPPAVAIVDPHRKDSECSFKFLSGVGVAFKLIMALEGDDCDIYSLLDNYADILSIGTVGDIVPLTGENRDFVKYGLKCIANTERCGLIAMINEAGINPMTISAEDMAYTIVPRINALGRLGDTQRMVSFLLSDDDANAAKEAAVIGENNRNRQSIEKDILQEVFNKIESDPMIKHRSIIVVDGENWHVGVIGIVASKVKETYGKPAVIITKNGQDAKGSCRSIEGFSICDALFYCKDLLTHCGGHPMAGGLGIKSENIPSFIEKINGYAEKVGMPYPTLNIDIKLKPEALSLDLAYELKKLEPFGAGNPAPMFGLYGVTLEQITPLSEGKHLKLTLNRGTKSFTAMKFSTTLKQFPYNQGDKLDIAVTIGVNTYNGRDYLSVIIKEMRFADADNEKMLSDMRLYDRLIDSRPLNESELERILPDRSDFALVYKFIKSSLCGTFFIDSICGRINSERINCGKICVILNALESLKLINYSAIGNKYDITVNKTENKVNLDDAPIIKKINELLKRG